MLNIIFCVFILLHGLVHLLYFAQSWRLLELTEGMTWPDGSWLFSRLIGEAWNRKLAGVSCILAAVAFATGGIGILFEQVWAFYITALAAYFSSVVVILFWNGKFEKLSDQGGVGLLINIGILAWLYLFANSHFYP